MKKRLILLALVAVAVSVSAAFAQEKNEKLQAADSEKADPALEQRIRGLIAQLGDTEWNKREAATDELKNIGKPAAPFLNEAKGNADPEIRSRAESILNVLFPPSPPPEPQRRQMIMGANATGGVVVFQLGDGIQVGGGIQMGGVQGNQKTTVTKSFTVDKKGYKFIQTTENNVSKLRAEVTETVDGKATTKVVETADEKELEKKDPELFKVYKANEGRANVSTAVQAAMAMQFGGNIGGAVPPPPNPPAEKTLDLTGSFGAKVDSGDDGLRVSDLKANTPADKLGLQSGDVLTSVNGQKLANLEDAKKALASDAKVQELEVKRGGKITTLKTP